MAAFYNNLFHTANPRTILQATVNNIQHGVEEGDTLVALHQIYKKLASIMELKLPYILEGFIDSEMLANVDQIEDVFMNKNLKDTSKQTDIFNQGISTAYKKKHNFFNILKLDKSFINLAFLNQ